MEVYRWYGRDNRECYVFEVDGELYHTHNPAGDWSCRKVTISTLEHHATMNHGIQRVRDIPDGLQEEIESLKT